MCTGNSHPAEDNALPVIPIILGPTGSGKTALVVDLVRDGRLTGIEVVSADSRQVYRFLDIGTAKPTEEERHTVPHNLVDILDPSETYSAGRFRRDAEAVIAEILKRGSTPVVVGGTGLYLKALVDGLSPIPRVPVDVVDRLRAEIASAGPAALHERLQELDSRCAATIQPTDTQRIIRALAVHEATGKPLSRWWEEHPEKPPYRYVWLGIRWDRSQLRDRIARRTRAMIARGLEREVRWLLDRGYTWEMNAMATVGYREWKHCFAGEITREEVTAAIAIHTAQYAKRQMTWFRTNPRITWVDGSSPSLKDEVVRWLDDRHAEAKR
ncbi:MAG TPA: tRNA (adenosine(37)-N6)-dimethylallyltransferase MiaA [Candidatus Latescibacteria bacterium]|nr:tRNA (adenosine(37)-N6)-dimethylallyltransferase MiaA [Candidatus Latescibacterota bacterium]